MEDAVKAVIRASRPQLRSPHDVMAFTLHATLMTNGYCLAAAGSRATAAAVQDPQLQEVSIEGWNDMDGAYAFKYFTDKKDLPRIIDVRCTCIGDKFMVDVVPVVSSDKAEPMNLEVSKNDNVEELARLYSSKLIPKLKLSSRRAGSEAEFQQQAFRTPAAAGSSSEGVDSTYLPGSAVQVPSVGKSDLIPSPGAGVFEQGPTAGFESGEGGNVVGPQHSLFGPRMKTDFPDGGLPVLPPGAVRFDPFGPPGVPGFDPERFGRDRAGRGHHPDLQHFQ